MDNYLIVLKEEADGWSFTIYRGSWRCGTWRTFASEEAAEGAAAEQIERYRWTLGPLAVGTVEVQVAQ